MGAWQSTWSREFGGLRAMLHRNKAHQTAALGSPSVYPQVFSRSSNTTQSTPTSVNVTDRDESVVASAAACCSRKQPIKKARSRHQAPVFRAHGRDQGVQRAIRGLRPGQLGHRWWGPRVSLPNGGFLGSKASSTHTQIDGIFDAFAILLLGPWCFEEVRA